MDATLERWRAAGETFDYLGFDIFFVRDGAGPPLLLVHGYPFSSFDWHAIWPVLRERFTLIAPDMLGMGFSDKPRRYEYSVLDHADMHEELLARLGVGHCHVLAHDLGVSVVQELLARGTLVLDSITWLNGGLFSDAYRPRPIQTLLSRTPLGALLTHVPQRAANALLRRSIDELFGKKPDPPLMRQLGEILEYNDGRSVTHLVGRFVNDRYVHRNRWLRAMRATDVPMRLIDGPRDPNSGRHMAARYRELIPGADVVMLGDDVGHWPQIEDPGGVLAAFLEFVTG